MLQYPAGYQKEKENKNEVEVEEGTPSKAKRKRKSQGNGELSILSFPHLNYDLSNLSVVNQMNQQYTFPHELSFYWEIYKFPFTESSKSSPAKTPKKVKVEEYKLTREQKTLIKNDTANKKVWAEAMQSLSLGPVRMAAYLDVCVRLLGLNVLCFGFFRNS